MKKYNLIIDQGTTSSRAILFDRRGRIVTMAQMEISLIYQKNGWVEVDPEEIWQSTLEVIRQVLNSEKVDPFQIESLGITNQRETTVLWNKVTQKAVYNAIVWQSRQSQTICEQLVQTGYLDVFKAKTGLIINPYFSGTKIKWIFDHLSDDESFKNAVANNEIVFGTIDTYLLWKLTGEHKTDYSNASRTLLFNIHSLRWDEELLELLQIPKSILPEVCDTCGEFGVAKTLNEIVPDLNLQVNCLIGDQQGSLFGQTCFHPGMTKNTYGTGCFMLMNTGITPIDSSNGLLTTIAWKIGDEVTYALEGSVYIAGSAVTWLRDSMKMIRRSKEVENYQPESKGIYVVQLL